jgi:hypothetical protein
MVKTTCGVCRMEVAADEPSVTIRGLGTVHLGPCPDVDVYEARVQEVEREMAGRHTVGEVRP